MTHTNPADQRLDASYYEPIGVLVGNADAADGRAQRNALAFTPRSGMVHVDGGDDDVVLVYYEEPGSYVNVQTFADRVLVAHGRAWSDRLRPGATGAASTHKLRAVAADAVTAVGVYAPREGLVVLVDGAAAAVKTWLGVQSDAELAAELRAEGSSRVRQRREIRGVLAGLAGKPIPSQVRSYAVRLGHGDLVGEAPNEPDHGTLTDPPRNSGGENDRCASTYRTEGERRQTR